MWVTPCTICLRFFGDDWWENCSLHRKSVDTFGSSHTNIIILCKYLFLCVINWYFFSLCSNVKKESCFFPIPQAAGCILRIIEKANAPVIYLSTDASGSETNLLQSLVVFNDRQVPLVRRPEHEGSEKWDALLYRKHMGGDDQVYTNSRPLLSSWFLYWVEMVWLNSKPLRLLMQVEAMLDKTICALSNVFIGSSGSTFTEDIFRLRRGWGSMSYCDEYLCQGELPNYIAELEWESSNMVERFIAAFFFPWRAGDIHISCKLVCTTKCKRVGDVCISVVHWFARAAFVILTRLEDTNGAFGLCSVLLTMCGKWNAPFSVLLGIEF